MAKTPRAQAQAKARNYAIAFLIQKYKDEYQELYRAYLVNRGFDVYDNTKPLVDERKLVRSESV